MIKLNVTCPQKNTMSALEVESDFFLFVECSYCYSKPSLAKLGFHEPELLVDFRYTMCLESHHS